MIGVRARQRIQIEVAGADPADPPVVTYVLARGAYGNCDVAGVRARKGCHSRAESVRLPRRQTPSPSTVDRISGHAIRPAWLLVVPARNDDGVPGANDRENSRRRVAAGDRGVRNGPGATEVRRAEDTRYASSARTEINFSLVVNRERCSARRKHSLARQRCGHLLIREFLPVLTVLGTHQQEFAIDWIAEPVAFGFRNAHEVVEKKCRTLAGKFERPALIAICGFVNARLRSSAD